MEEYGIDLKTLDLIKQQAVDLAFSVGPKLILGLIIYLIGKYLINFVQKIMSKAFEKSEVDPSLATFLKSFAKAILWVLLLISIATTMGVEMTSFVAILGAAGLAVGLALQGSLANFAGGVLILMFKPFKVGDTVEAQGTTGEVESIDILYTKIRNFDNKLVTVPNGILANNLIVNYSQKTTRRVDMKVGIAYGTDIKKARKIILEVLNKDERIHKDPESVVHFGNFGDNSLDLTIRCWTDTENLWPVFWDNMEAIKEALEVNEVSIPFPQRDVHHFYPEGKK
jgi:small conductance mechanosensitive channel